MATSAVYARISLDRHDGEGVGRQLADCRALAAERGWDDPVEYVDNDISAFRAKQRPAWDQLIEDLEAGKVDAVVAYHPDRLYRRLADLERLITVLEAQDVAVATCRAGDIDLSTATGRMTARIIAAVASAESERTGERVARAKRERAAQGRPSGGGRRPFGLTADRLALEPDEAAQIRTTAANLLAGATYGDEVRRLTAAGYTTTTGRPWYTGGLRRVITSPYVAGLRSYRGEIVGDTVTPPILDRDTWDLLRLDAKARARRGRPPGDRHLLTGIIRCAACDRPMFGSSSSRGHRVYRCIPQPGSTGVGCNRSIAADTLEAHVLDTVAGWLDDPELLQALTHAPVSPDHADEIDELERRRTVAAARWAAGELTNTEYETARDVITTRLAKLTHRTAGPWAVVDADVLAGYRAGWDAATTAERRAIIGALAVTPLRVGPGRSGSGPGEVTERISIARRWG